MIKNFQKFSFGPSGFTLIETLLSVAVIGVIATIFIPVSISLQNRNNLTTATHTITLAARQAQSFAQGGHGEESWSIYIDEGAVTIFEGEIFGSTPESEDERTFSPNITVTGDTTVTFEPLTGELQSGEEATIILTNIDDATATVTINAKGFVSY